MELVDSGTRKEFSTGAVRDGHIGVGRCDLLPLHQVAALLDDEIIKAIGDYEESGNTSSLQKAIGLFSDMVFGSQYTAMLEAAKQYEDGARKYSDRNWENGIPVHCFIDSGVRHYLKFRRGDTDEPHDRAFVWNMLGAIWTHENKPELIDLPFANKDKPDSGIQITDKPEPEKGKRDSVSDGQLQSAFCRKWGDVPCDECPIGPSQNRKGMSCSEFVRNYPDDFRRIAIEYLEARE